MGFVRAIGGDKWSDVTHVAGNSGGNWLGTQLVFSGDLFAQLVSDRNLVEVVAEWGTNYSNAEKHAVDDDTWASNYDAGKCGAGKYDVAKLVNTIVGIVQSRFYFPATNWLGYVSTMLSPQLPSIKTARYSNTVRGGLPDVTYVQALSLGPDAYVNKSTYIAGWTAQSSDAHDSAENSCRSIAGMTTASLDVSFSNSSTQKKWDQQGGALLPIAFFSSKESSGWMHHPDIAALTISSGRRDKKVSQNLALPSDPLLGETTSGSSSAAALFGSPSMTKTALDLIGAGALEIGLAMQCMPLGLEKVSSPAIQGCNAEEAQQSQWAPHYRFSDGAFTDNTALTWTVSKMQADCAASKIDCEDGIRIILVNDEWLDYSYLSSSLRKLFKSTNSSDTQYTTPGNFCPPSIEFPAPKPSSNIFAETFPSDEEWTPYAEFTYTPPPRNPSDTNGVRPQNAADQGKATPSSTSLYWEGTVTTVDNPYFGVSGGQKVHLLVFETQPPKIDAIIVPGLAAPRAFQDVYGPIAASQAEGAAPIISKFLN